jgi:hypothetical protein
VASTTERTSGVGLTRGVGYAAYPVGGERRVAGRDCRKVQRHVALTALSAGAVGGHGVESQVRDAAQRLATNLLSELSSAAGNDLNFPLWP